MVTGPWHVMFRYLLPSKECTHGLRKIRASDPTVKHAGKVRSSVELAGAVCPTRITDTQCSTRMPWKDCTHCTRSYDEPLQRLYASSTYFQVFDFFHPAFVHSIPCT